MKTIPQTVRLGALITAAATVGCANRTAVHETAGLLNAASLQRVSPTEMAREKQLNGVAEQAAREFNAHQFDLAERDYKKLIQLDPKNPFRYRNLGKLYDVQGRELESFEAWRRALAGAPRSASNIQTDPAILTRYGELSLKFGKRQDAQSAFETASLHIGRLFSQPVDIDGNEFKDFVSLRALAHYSAGVEEFAHGKFKEAQTDLSQSVSLKPDWALGHLAYGFVLYHGSRREAASGQYALAEKLAKGNIAQLVLEEEKNSGLHGNNRILSVNVDPNGKVTQAYADKAQLEAEMKAKQDQAKRNVIRRISPLT